MPSNGGRMWGMHIKDSQRISGLSMVGISERVSVGVKFGYGIVDFAFNTAFLEKGKPVYKAG